MEHLAVAAAGSAGALLRYWLGLALQPLCPSFPLHTFVVNVVGCFAFGVCWSIGAERWPAIASAAVLTGFFGAFTTFSSFAFDCTALLEQGRYWAAAGNALGQNGLGLLAMASGIALGRAF
jgi:CrcB protein